MTKQFLVHGIWVKQSLSMMCLGYLKAETMQALLGMIGHFLTISATFYLVKITSTSPSA
jgi:hypothetical protein